MEERTLWGSTVCTSKKKVWIVGTPYKIGYPLFLPKSLDMYGDGETVPKLAKFWVRWIIPIVRLGVEYENWSDKLKTT